MRGGDEGDSLSLVVAVVSPLPDDVEALKALLTAAIQRADEAEARAASAVSSESAIEGIHPLKTAGRVRFRP